MPECLRIAYIDYELCSDDSGAALSSNYANLFSIVDKKLVVELGTLTDKPANGVYEMVLKAYATPTGAAYMDLHVNLSDDKTWFLELLKTEPDWEAYGGDADAFTTQVKQRWINTAYGGGPLTDDLNQPNA